MASIYRNQNGNWTASIRRKNHSGISKSFKHFSDAKSWASKTESELNLHTPIKSRRTLHEALSRFEKDILPLYKSHAQRAGELRRFRHHFPDLPLRKITAHLITRYRDQRLETGVSGSTVIKELNLLSKVFDVALREWEWIIDNPVKKVRKPKAGKSRDRRLSEEETTTLINECERTNHHSMKNIILLAIETGMRQGELLNLHIEQINQGNHTLHLPDTKNGSPRDVPLSPTALSAIKAQIGIRETGKLFDNWSTGNGFRSSFKRLCKRLSLENFRFHDLRHEAASRLFEKGLNQFQVAAITGHKSLQSLQRYTHLRAEDLAKLLK